MRRITFVNLPATPSAALHHISALSLRLLLSTFDSCLSLHGRRMDERSLSGHITPSPFPPNQPARTARTDSAGRPATITSAYILLHIAHRWISAQHRLSMRLKGPRVRLSSRLVNHHGHDGGPAACPPQHDVDDTSDSSPDFISYILNLQRRLSVAPWRHCWLKFFASRFLLP